MTHYTARTPRRVHFRTRESDASVCGTFKHPIVDGMVTMKPERVTCERCLAAPAFRTAQRVKVRR